MSSELENTTITTTKTYDEDIKKYTKIDNLDEDPVVDSARFFLVSFISPEGVMNCTTRGFKLRTYKNKVCFSTLEEATNAATEMNKTDKYFHVFVGEPGKWMGWDPNPDDRTKVESEKWADSEQDALMQKMREKEEKQTNDKKQLNELNALVGKKKDMINKEGKQHKKRVATAIKDSANPQEQTELVPTEAVQTELVDEETALSESSKNKKKEKAVRRLNHDSLMIREKLRKKLQQQKMNDPELEKPKDTREFLKEQLEETVETKTKLENNIKKINDLLEKAKKS